MSRCSIVEADAWGRHRRCGQEATVGALCGYHAHRATADLASVKLAPCTRHKLCERLLAERFGEQP